MPLINFSYGAKITKILFYTLPWPDRCLVISPFKIREISTALDRQISRFKKENDLIALRSDFT